MIKIALFILLTSFLTSCGSQTDLIHKAHKKSDQLIEKIANGTAGGKFSAKYFEPKGTDKILKQLQYDCDFANRKGGFSNDVYQKNLGADNEIFFLYEFKVRCGDIRIIEDYILNDSLVLKGLHIEPTSAHNLMSDPGRAPL